MTGAATPGRSAALFSFALVYAAMETVWWYVLAPPGEDLGLLALDIAAEAAIFGCSIAIGSLFLKTRLPAPTKRNRHNFALTCVGIVWTVLIAMAAVESLIYGDVPFGDLFAEYDSWDLGLMLAIAVTLLAVAVVVISGLYYFVARLILHFVTPSNRIAVQ